MASGGSVSEQVRAVLMGYVSSISADSVLKGALRRVGRSPVEIDREGVDEPLVAELGRGLAFFLSSDAEKRESLAKLSAIKQSGPRSRLPSPVTVSIVDESGVVDARTHARAFARDIGFDRTDQARIATTVSELARNVYSYARTGRIELTALDVPRLGVAIVSVDEGPGIANLSEILEGNYRSRTGMGLGIIACKRLMDEFSIVTERGRGTTVTVKKYVA